MFFGQRVLLLLVVRCFVCLMAGRPEAALISVDKESSNFNSRELLPAGASSGACSCTQPSPLLRRILCSSACTWKTIRTAFDLFMFYIIIISRFFHVLKLVVNTIFNSCAPTRKRFTKLTAFYLVTFFRFFQLRWKLYTHTHTQTQTTKLIYTETHRINCGKMNITCGMS